MGTLAESARKENGTRTALTTGANRSKFIASIARTRIVRGALAVRVSTIRPRASVSKPESVLALERKEAGYDVHNLSRL